MSKKEQQVGILKNVLLSVFFGLLFTLIVQFVHNGEFDFSWYAYWLPSIFGASFGYLVVTGIPVAKWGVALAIKLKAKPGSFLFGLVVSFTIAIIFVPVMINVMSVFGAVVIPSIQFDLANVAPVIPVIQSTFVWGGIPLFFIITWPIALVVEKPLDMLARAILKAPAHKPELAPKPE